MKKVMEYFFTEPYWTPFGMLGYICWMLSFDERMPLIVIIICQIIAFLAFLNAGIQPFKRKK